MSRQVKELVRRELAKRFEGLTSLAVVGFSGVDGVKTHEIRRRLRGKDIVLMVVKNSMARQAFKAVGLDVAAGMLDGPCALAYGADSVVTVVRELLDIGKEAPGLTVKAALLEGELFGPEDVTELSRFPTRDEAIRNVVSCVLWPGRKLAGCLVGPGAMLASIVKAIEEKRSGDGAEAA